MEIERDEKLEEKFRYGHCYPMAYALSERLGWEVEALVVDLPNESHMVHVWVVDPEGNPFDAAGRFDRDGLHDEYLVNACRKWSNDRLERFANKDEYLSRLKQLCGERFWPSYRKDCFDPLHAKAAKAIEDYVLPRYLPESSPAPSF